MVQKYNTFIKISLINYMKLKTLFLIITISCLNIVVAQTNDLPHIVKKDNRYALIVDGEPFLILGAQCNNSSAWPATLPYVFSAMKALNVNTLEIPVYWEQFEPQEGVFDYSVVDEILIKARENNLRLVLLWFGTWKNSSNHYMPVWMKLQPDKYPNMINSKGEEIDSPSPHIEATLKADIKAFSALMKHLKEIDKQHTVIMVQVENEPGCWDSQRDFSKNAEKLFNKPIPEEILKALKLSPVSNKSWTDVFGKDADEFFYTWHVATFINQVAKAGKEIYPLPLYVNAAVRNPFNPGVYEVGGPTDNVFHIWEAAAPDIDILSPDIYENDTEVYLKLLELYSYSDNPLFVPETKFQNPFPRFFYSALGYGAIGYAPFGLDNARVRIKEDGEVMTDEELLEPTALNYRIFKPMAREIAKLNFEGKIKTAVQETAIDPQSDKGNSTDRKNYITDKTLSFDGWDLNVAFGTFGRLNRLQTQPEQPDGRILVAELNKNQFLITGYHARVMPKPVAKTQGCDWYYLKVEEGSYENGEFIVKRILNGDQTDWGLIFNTPAVIRVTLYAR